jgi:hypothetical protein
MALKPKSILAICNSSHSLFDIKTAQTLNIKQTDQTFYFDHIIS